MDIQKIQEAVEQDDVAVDVPIFARNGEPDTGSDGTPTVFGMLGRDSEKVKRVMERQQRAWSRHRGPIDPKQILANRIEIAVAALAYWRGVDDNGTPVALAPDVAKTVFSDRHYLEQAEEGIANHARFFTTGSAS